MNSYLILNRYYELADYLVSVRDVKQRQILTKYRLSDHYLAVETGRHRKAEKVEAEEHFLLHFKKYDILRQIYFTKLQIHIPDFADMEHKDKLAILLVEGPSAALAAQYVLKFHNLRDSV